ncbi:MAG: hypothetical protein MJ168_05480 [Clostridia bacterium]|nr:hypothetical protein [Clostridia bacterium]
MKIQHIFPIILIILDICAAAVYAYKKDVRMTTYWIAAAVLNICVLKGA